MRVPRSPVALARARRNIEALEWFRGGRVDDRLASVVPAPVVSGQYAGYGYFVETRLPGSAAAPVASNAWRPMRC